MKKRILRMTGISNKRGIFSWFGFELPLAERLKLIKEAGFDSTSVWLGEEEELVKSGKEDMIPELVRDCGLFLENIHAPFEHCNKLWSEDSGERRDIKDEYDSCISFCSKHNIPIVVVHICRSSDAPEFNERGLDTIGEIVKYAEDSDVILAVENTRKSHYYLDQLYSSIESPFLGFCYDSSHDFLSVSEPGRILRRWGHLLVATHLSDNDGISDKHWIPEEGIIDWGIVKDHFPKYTYTGFLTLEVVPKTGELGSARSFLKKAFESVLWLESFLKI
jgi:sugar phosphate isomerase/epimerase